jgi:hypothetical protein
MADVGLLSSGGVAGLSKRPRKAEEAKEASREAGAAAA